MIDAVKILGSMFQQGTAPAAQDRLRNAVQGNAGGGLDRLLAQFGGSGGSLGSALGGLLGQATGGKTLDEILAAAKGAARRAADNPVEETKKLNPAAVGGLGALAGALFGGGKGALGGGIMAVLGSLAYSALQTAGNTPAAPDYADQDRLQQKALVMLRAMIQAAKADGRIDEEEMQRIAGRLAEAGEDQAARQFVLEEMRKPVDIPGLAAAAKSPQEAAEIYAASLMAIAVDSAAERDYLAQLAAALNIPQQVASHIQATLGTRA